MRRTVIRARGAAGLLAVALAASAGCATAPPRTPESAAMAQARLAGPRGAARGGLAALARGDVRGARGKFASAARGRDPWGHLGLALLAHRELAPDDEVRALVATVAAAPGGPLAPLALRRLAGIADEGGPRAAAVEAGLAPLAGAGRLRGVAAYRARVARTSAAESRGDLESARRLRAENGAVDRWSFSGPWSAFHALELDRAFPPETGDWPAEAPAPRGVPARPTRAIEAPDGTFALDGESPREDVYYLAADATLARGGRYLLTLGTTGSARLFVDGVAVAERDDVHDHAPTIAQRELALAPGPHRVLLKLVRGRSRGSVQVSLARLDGAASDATYAAATPGPVPKSAPPAVGPRAVATTPDRAAELEAAAGGPIGAVLAALEALDVDREGAKRVLDAAAPRLPKLALARVVRAGAAVDDPTLDEGVARARAEAELRAALALDPGDAAARVELAGLLAATGRLDDAEETLAELTPAAARRPGVLVARAKLANARGFTEVAGARAAEALAAGGGCDALALVADAAERREAVAAREDAMGRLAECAGGRERLALYRSGRGEPRAALDALEPLGAARPWAVETAFARAAAHVAAGEPQRAVEALGALRAVWPRSPRVAKRLADAHELAGDAAAARRERERALALDPADLALRRALALDDGTEVLAGWAEDGRAAIRAYERSQAPRTSSSAMVLDAAAVEVHAGGAATERIHQVIHVRDPSGADAFGELDVPADADVLVARTLKRDGRVLEPDAAGSAKGSLSLSGLEPGDYVEFEYLRSDRGDVEPGGYAADPFYFQVTGTSLFRSSYVVVAPRGLGLEVDAKGMPTPPVAVEGDREVVRALRTEVPALVPEPGAPQTQELVPALQVGVGGGREQLARAVGDEAIAWTRPSEELRRFAGELRRAAGPQATPERLARAAYDAVAKRVLGGGGVLTQDASAILSRGRGSRLGVLAAVLSELGFEARVVVVRPFASDPRPARFPGPAQFSAMVLRARRGGETFWLDPSQRLAPFGAIHPGLLDVEALVAPAPGEEVEVTRTPAAPRVQDLRSVELDVTLAEDGSAEVRGVDRYDGYSAGVARTAFEQLEPDERARSLEGMLARTFRGLAVEAVDVQGEDDGESPLVVRWRGRVPHLARVAGDALVIDAPIHPARLAGRFVRVASRKTPLLLAQDERVAQVVRITPPAGFAASASAPAELSGALGTFGRAERVEGGALVREERIALQRGRYAAEAYPAVARFAAAVDDVQERPTVFSRAR